MINTQIKMLRVKHNYSQQDCAKMLGLSRQGYRLKESGTVKFKFDEVIKLLKIWNELDNLKNYID